MKFASKILGIAVLPVFAAALTGCGSTNLGQSVQLKLDPITQSAKLEVELSDGLQVSMTGTYLIQSGYGNVYFVEPTKTTNGRIGVEISLASVIGGQLDLPIMNTLPSGAPLPVAITPPIFALPVHKDASFDIKAALSLTPELQVGALVGISAFSSNYVIPGVAVCQNFRNSDKAAYAAVCIYGPSANGQEKGGIFVAGTFGKVIPDSILTSSQPETISLASKSSVFAMSSSASASAMNLNLPAMDLNSNKFDSTNYDPKKQMFTSAGQKSFRNIQKVLKVRK